MSNFLTEKNWIKYSAVDNHFWGHQYWYIELDKLSEKKFLTEEEFNNL